MAATSNISAVFNARTGLFDKGTKAVVAGLNKVSKGAKSTGSALKTLRNIEVFRLFSSAIGTASRALGKLRRELDTVVNGIDKSAKTARTLGMSFEGYEGLALVFRESGVEATLAEAMIAKLLRRVGEARKGGKFAVNAFNAIGMSLEELKTISEEDVFSRTIQGLKDIDNAFERQRVSQLLFEETGARLGSVIEKGAAGFKEAAKAVRDFGLVLRTGQFKAVEELKDNIERSKLSIIGLKRQIVANLAPAIAGVAKMWNDWVRSIGVENLGASLADRMMDAVIAAADWYDSISGGINKIVTALESVKDQTRIIGKAAQVPFQIPKQSGAILRSFAADVTGLAAELGYMVGAVDKDFRDTTRINAAIAAESAAGISAYNAELLGLSSATQEAAAEIGTAGKAAREWAETSKRKRESAFKEEKKQQSDTATAISTAISSKLASLDARSQEGVNFVLAQTTLRRQTVEQQQLAELKKIQQELYRQRELGGGGGPPLVFIP